MWFLQYLDVAASQEGLGEILFSLSGWVGGMDGMGELDCLLCLFAVSLFLSPNLLCCCRFVFYPSPVPLLCFVVLCLNYRPTLPTLPTTCHLVAVLPCRVVCGASLWCSDVRTARALVGWGPAVACHVYGWWFAEVLGGLSRVGRAWFGGGDGVYVCRVA